MLFRQHFLNGIGNGTITLAFRKWQRPSVKSGGTLLTAVGQLHISSVAEVALSEISKVDARRAGYESLDGLLVELNRYDGGKLHRIEFGPLTTDPRIALRQTAAPSKDECKYCDFRPICGPYEESRAKKKHQEPLAQLTRLRETR